MRDSDIIGILLDLVKRAYRDNRLDSREYDKIMAFLYGL